MSPMERHMHHRSIPGPTLLIIVAVIGLAASAGTRAQDTTSTSTPPSEHTDEPPFLAESVAAMNKMMSDMAVKPTGDVDADFAAMMIPHHQGAIEMALAELRYGRNEQLRRIAQEIIVDQQQEIAAMRLALGQPLPPSTSVPTQVSPSLKATPSATPAHDQSKASHRSMQTPTTRQTK